MTEGAKAAAVGIAGVIAMIVNTLPRTNTSMRDAMSFMVIAVMIYVLRKATRV